jgi:hypothetical protein
MKLRNPETTERIILLHGNGFWAMGHYYLKPSFADPQRKAMSFLDEVFLSGEMGALEVSKKEGYPLYYSMETASREARALLFPTRRVVQWRGLTKELRRAIESGYTPTNIYEMNNIRLHLSGKYKTAPDSAIKAAMNYLAEVWEPLTRRLDGVYCIDRTAVPVKLSPTDCKVQNLLLNMPKCSKLNPLRGTNITITGTLNSVFVDKDGNLCASLRVINAAQITPNGDGFSWTVII